jgi:aldehyde:ferredoxin oxidoreductase
MAIALTADRLRAMIDSYYKMRGLDPEGRPDPAIVDDFGLA